MSSRSLPALFLAVVTISFSIAAPPAARADAATCSAAKLIGLSRAVDKLLGCRARSAAKALAVDPACAVQVDDLADLLPDTTTVPRTWHYAVYGCDISDNCEDTGSHTTLAPTVVQVLRAGGYVVHSRHASADVCSDATHLGTAVLMDFGPTIEESQDITYFVYDEAERCNNSFALLGEVPTAGTNTALIGHAGFTCPPLSQLAWAEAAIYKPDGMGGTTFIERVLAADWLTLP